MPAADVPIYQSTKCKTSWTARCNYPGNGLLPLSPVHRRLSRRFCDGVGPDRILRLIQFEQRERLLTSRDTSGSFWDTRCAARTTGG